MAATPEEFLGLSEDPPPSPSIFLDLPPTPHDQDQDPSSPEDLVLPYISRMLMEEDIDDKFFYQYPDQPTLLHIEQPFVQILSSNSSSDSTSDNTAAATTTTTTSNSTLSPSSSAAATTWPYDPLEFSRLQSPPYPDMLGSAFFADGANAFFPDDGASTDMMAPPFFNGMDNGDAFLADDNGNTNALSSTLLTGAEETKTVLPGVKDDARGLSSAFFNASDAAEDKNLRPGDSGNMDMLNLAFLKGMEEAKKFLPSNNGLVIDLEESSKGMDHAKRFMPSDDKLMAALLGANVKEEAVDGLRGRKNRYHGDELETEIGRTSKQMALQSEDAGAREMFDDLMINGYAICLKGMEDLRIAMETEAEKNGRKGNGKTARGRRAAAREVVDLHTLLIHCAQAVATDDRRSASELLKQIKRHASPTGDATERLAHCFAEGLQARLAGTGSQVYRALMAKRTSVVEFLKAYLLLMAACCFRKVAFVFSNNTIYKAVAGRSKVHIVDYGIHYGFQWPGLLQFLATREGGPPEVRITGIDLPQPGFRPAERIEETGRRLSHCARQFGVPFKFRAIAAKWETVRAEDLDIDPDEVLVVNGLFHFRNLMDESVVVDNPSPRDVVLSNIRKMRPHVFILGIVNGSYSAPFFVTRFREALFYYSAHFDMMDATTPRDNEQRLLVERDIFGRCALNVIACEGADRVERPETYKQWQVRNHRAGLRQLPLDPEIVRMARTKVTTHYHKDFVIDEDHRWLLVGWKGRILYAFSAWVADDTISDF